MFVFLEYVFFNLHSNIPLKLCFEIFWRSLNQISNSFFDEIHFISQYSGPLCNLPCLSENPQVISLFLADGSFSTHLVDESGTSLRPKLQHCLNKGSGRTKYCVKLERTTYFLDIITGRSVSFVFVGGTKYWQTLWLLANSNTYLPWGGSIMGI